MKIVPNYSLDLKETKDAELLLKHLFINA